LTFKKYSCSYQSLCFITNLDIGYITTNSARGYNIVFPNKIPMINKTIYNFQFTKIMKYRENKIKIISEIFNIN